MLRDCDKEARSLGVSVKLLVMCPSFSNPAALSLRYVKSAKASTDVPTTVPEFISQRRRWLNGSLFAAVHVTTSFFRVWTSGHNVFRKLWIQIEFIYNAVQLFFTWTSLAHFYLASYFVSSPLRESIAVALIPFL